MAFVYCDNRWKGAPGNQMPGPGKYEVDRVQVPLEKKKSSHHHSPNFRRTNEPNPCSDKEMHSKTWYSQQQHQETLQQSIKLRRQSTKKGKLYRKTAAHKTDKLQCEHNDKLYINNSEKNLNEKDRWGNMRIIELLKQHKEKQRKIPIKRFSNPTKRNVFTYQNRQQLQTDLKEMEILFNSQRNRNQNTFSLKNLNREISSKQKQRENKSHNYYLTVNKAMTGLKEEKNNQELSVQPSVIYKTPLDETLNRPQTAFGDSQPFSVEQSKIMAREPTVQTATGLSDDLFEDSMEYIQDATPGPGAYNLDTSSLTSLLKQSSGKRIQKFGVTMQRFKINKDKVQQAQSYLNPSYPVFKKPSQARQQAVGFGKGTKDQKDPEPVHNGVFYQDTNNLSAISKKALLKGKNNIKFGFESCQQRFEYQNVKRLSTESQEEIIEEEEEEEYPDQIIPSYVFLSKVQRELSPSSPITENVDFSGQNYSCIAHKIKKQKQFYEDYQIKPVPFMVKDNRFKYDQLRSEEKKEELKLIKIKELKEKKQNKNQKSEKGYSFGREEKREPSPRQVPPPDHYELEQDWIKKTYNLRFR